jgi:hypothetical protein
MYFIEVLSGLGTRRVRLMLRRSRRRLLYMTDDLFFDVPSVEPVIGETRSTSTATAAPKPDAG